MSPRKPRSDAPLATSTPLPWRALLRTRWVLVVIVAELLLAATVAYGLWALRRQTLAGELRTLGSLSAAMAAQADATLAVADAALRATRAELADGLLAPASASTQAFLRTRIASLPEFRALVIADAQGQRLASSREGALPATSVAHRDFFVAARDRMPGGLFVGSPYISRADGLPAIGIALDRRGPGGRFDGVIALIADPEFLDGRFSRIKPTADTGLAIYRHDRELVSDGPGDGTAHLLPARVVDALWAQPAPRAPQQVTLPDGSRRLIAAQKLQRHALLVVLTRDTRVALADWTEQAWLVGSFAASALLVTLLLTFRNAREQAARRTVEAALAAEQQRAVRAFHAAQEGYWEWNPRSRASHMSPRMKELLGLARDDSLGPDRAGPLPRAALHPDDAAGLRAAFRAHADGRSPVFDCTFRVRWADGCWHWVRARGHAWRDAQGSAVLYSGTAADVTAEIEGHAHERRLAAQLQHARRLEAIGTLAGGVAHDFNNILAAILGYAELARRTAGAASGQARHIDRIVQAGQRGTALVERILALGRGMPRAHVTLRLQPVVEEVLQLLAASLPNHIRLDQRLRASDAAVVGDATTIHEAVMNLCSNAVQAMPAGGTLRVELELVEPAAPLALFETQLPPGRHARLLVQDSGSGIAPDVMARLFEPFFTTKPPGSGTGFGLPVVRSVMAELGGAIDVGNVEGGGGARFTLYFPCVEPGPDSAPLVEEVVPRGTGQRVLVIDDEAALVELAEEMLAELGYEPSGTASSTRALAEFEADPARFDLVLTDQLMPEMTGCALAARLTALRPKLPVLLVSGWGGPDLDRSAADAGVAMLLKKPLARAELARALHAALQPREGRRPGSSAHAESRSPKTRPVEPHVHRDENAGRRTRL